MQYLVSKENVKECAKEHIEIRTIGPFVRPWPLNLSMDPFLCTLEIHT